MSKHKSFSNKVFVTLQNKVARLNSLKVVNHLINDEKHDFTRERKLPFNDVIMIILSMAGAPLQEELHHYFNYVRTNTSASLKLRAKSF
jgi:hypothetical protein